VITFYAAPLDDGSGYVIHRCAGCRRRHVLDSLGVRRLPCHTQAVIKSSTDRPARSPAMSDALGRAHAVAEARAAASEAARLAAALSTLASRPGPPDPALADLQRRHNATATRAAALAEQQLAKRGWANGL
jgi:hypothetical protein